MEITATMTWMHRSKEEDWLGSLDLDLQQEIA